MATPSSKHRSSEVRVVVVRRISARMTTGTASAGTLSYLDVVVAPTTARDNERAAVDLRAGRMVAAVLLVKALGGGWTPSEGDAAR
jgi:outer membrane protein TolC